MRITKFDGFIPQNVAPPNAVKIGVYLNNKKVGDLGLGNLKMPDLGEKLYSFGAISDIHIQDTASNTAKDDLIKALTYFKGSEVAFVCVCGDMTDGGTAKQLGEYRNYVSTYIDKPVYAIAGNHETYGVYHNANEFGGLSLQDAIQEYTGKPLYFSFEHGNDVFIMLGIKSEGELFTADEIQWLYDTLEANRNKRCFVFQHVFAGEEHETVCGNPYGLYENHCWGNEVHTAIFESLMEHYKNVIWFHGHSHFRFGLQAPDCPYANIDRSEGYWSVHIPSIAIPRIDEDENNDGKPDYDNSGSEGYVVDVYEKHVVLRGRDFVSDKFLPIATYCIDTEVQNIPVGTYTDSTGTIIT